MIKDVIVSLEEIYVQALDAREHVTSGGDPSEFLNMLDIYLSQLEVWQKKHAATLQSISNGSLNVSDADRAELRALLENVKVIHSELIANSQNLMQEVHTELGSINKRAQGIRKYVDTLPSRVSTTSFKKG